MTISLAQRKVIYNKYKESVIQILKDLCKWKGVEIIEGKAMVDHVHLLLSIPPKYSISSLMGYLNMWTTYFSLVLTQNIRGSIHILLILSGL